MEDEIEALIQKFEGWADANDEICQNAFKNKQTPAWQASGYMHAYRNAAAELRKLLNPDSSSQTKKHN